MAQSKEMFNLRALERDFAYSQAIKSGKHLYISGTVSWDADGNPLGTGDMAVQIKNVYEELKKTLEAHGGGFEHVVRERVYTTDFDALVKNAHIRKSYYEGCIAPSAVWVQVVRLVHEDLLLEVELTAELPQ